MSNFKIYNILCILCFLLVPVKLDAQKYFNKVLDTEVENPNAGLLSQKGEAIRIGSISFPNKTIIIEGLSPLNNFSENSIDNFSFANKGFIQHNDHLFLYGKNRNIPDNLELMKYDEDWNLSWSKIYHSTLEYCFPTSIVFHEDHFYLASTDETKDQEHEEFHLKKVDLEGIEIWNKNYGIENKFNYASELDIHISNNLVACTGIAKLSPPGIYAHLYMLDTSGQTLWEIQPEENPANGTASNNIACLSNGNIIFTTAADRAFDEYFILNNLYPKPPRLMWYDEDGNFLQDTLITSPKFNQIRIKEIEDGLGNYFFGYGDWSDPETNIFYGWLFKMSYEGEMIWNKRYSFSEHISHGGEHRINDIVEKENGDILCLGNSGYFEIGSKIWLFNINKYGCFGEEECPDDVIFTGIEDIIKIEKAANIFPNPTYDHFRFETDSNILFSSYSIYSSSGKKLISDSMDFRTLTLNISNLPSGVLFIKFRTKDGLSIYKKIVKI